MEDAGLNYVFVINPAAGKGGKQDEIAKKIREFFKDRPEKINIYLSCFPGDAIKFGKEYPLDGEETCFVACGGDGTFYEVLNGAFGRENVCFATYPCGSGNDFIKSIGGTKDDYLDLNKLVNGTVKSFDAMRVNNRISANLCNIGMDSVVCDKMNKYKKIPGISGPMAYNISTVTTVLDCIVHKPGSFMRFEFDDKQVIEGRYILSVFGNGNIYGGGYHPVPDARIDDGIIDFCTVNEISILKMGSLLGEYKAGKHVNDPKIKDIITMRKCTQCHITSDESLTVCVDGEIFKSDDIQIEILPSSLPFVVPEGIE